MDHIYEHSGTDLEELRKTRMQSDIVIWIQLALEWIIEILDTELR